MKTPTRLHWIDLLESLAIFFVIFYHSTTYFFDITAPGSDFIISLRYGLRAILSVCVPLFFFANGYLLLNKPLDLHKHFRKTIKFTLLAFFWYLFTMSIMLLLRYQSLQENGLTSTLQDLKYTINHLWYMGALVCVYLFFPLLKLAFDHNRRIFIYFLIICAVLTFGNTLLNELATLFTTLIGRPHIFHETNFFKIFNPFRGIYGYTFVYFCLGGLFKTFQAKILAIPVPKRNLIAIGSIIISTFGLYLTAFLYSRLSGSIWDIVWNGYDTIFTFINVLAIVVLCLNYKKSQPLLTFISSNTLGIYFIHMIFIEATRPTLLTHHIFTSFLGNLIYAAIILLISLIATSALRKIPLLKHLIS